MTPQDFENALNSIRLGIREQGFIGGLNATRPLFPSMTLIERRNLINRNFSSELSEFQIKFSQQTKELEQSEEAREWYAAKYGWKENRRHVLDHRSLVVFEKGSHTATFRVVTEPSGVATIEYDCRVLTHILGTLDDAVKHIISNLNANSYKVFV